MKKINCILDCEFTGLDNGYIDDNEIISISYLIFDDEKNIIEKWYKNFSSKKENSVWSFLVNGLKKSDLPENFFFNKEKFMEIFKNYDIDDDINFIFFAESMDKKMLAKYGIYFIDNTEDVQENMRLCRKYEEKMAREGSSLECCYFYIFEKKLEIKHNKTFEVEKIFEMILEDEKIMARSSCDDSYFNFYPFGYWAWMPLYEFCEENRKNADWYRYNNNDILSCSLNYCCDIIDGRRYDDEDEEDFFDIED